MNMNDSAPSLEPSIMIAMLAAGKATRFGGGKLARTLADKPLWQWAANTAVAAGFVQRVCIIRDGWAPAREMQTQGWSVVVNPEAEAGIASSIKLACTAAATCRRLVIALADMPFVTNYHLRALAHSEGVVFTRYASGHIGVPAAFPQDAFRRLAMLEGDRGAASLNWGPGLTTLTPASPDTLIDIDTPEDLVRAHNMLARR